MERRLSISILNTESRSKGLFSRSYTVNPIKVYQIKTVIDFSDMFYCHKRYSELLDFSQFLSPYIEKYRVSLPDFPKKCLNVSKSIIEDRKLKLQDWLQALAKCPKLFNKLCQFLNINTRLLLIEDEDLHPDDLYVREFISLLQNDSNQKLSILKIFSMKFLARRRKINSDSIVRLLRSLIPLVPKAIFTGIVLDLLLKMMSREYFSVSSSVLKEFCELPLALLQSMSLDEILVSSRTGEGQALEVLKVIKASSPSADLLAVVIATQLNRSQHALNIFNCWSSTSLAPKARSSASTDALWSVLYSNEKFRISYKCNLDQLDLDINLSLNSSLSTLIDLITDPCGRVRWDGKIKTMKADSNKCIFEIMNKRKVTQVHADLAIESFESYHKITFNDLEDSGLTSSFCIEQEFKSKQEESFFSSENKTCTTAGSCNMFDEDVERFKVLMRISCKGTFMSMYKDDVVHESNELMKSIKRFVLLAENIEVEEEDFDECGLDSACSRKLLNRSVLI